MSDAEFGPGKFQRLFTGEIDKLRLCVCVGATSAKREDHNVAVWELNRAWMIRIADSIKQHENKYASRNRRRASNEEAAIACDEIGIENRFFRLNEVVAEWIDATEPVSTDVDFIVM